jgi:hypothetical protein
LIDATMELRTMTPMKPPKVAKPLSSKELEADAAEAGVPVDETARAVGDTHLPASESGELERSGSGPLSLEQRMAELPPG